jgi:hypothetical protein
MDDGGDAYEIAPLFHVSVSYIYKVLGRRRGDNSLFAAAWSIASARIL